MFAADAERKLKAGRLRSRKREIFEASRAKDARNPRHKHMMCVVTQNTSIECTLAKSSYPLATRSFMKVAFAVNWCVSV